MVTKWSLYSDKTEPGPSHLAATIAALDCSEKEGNFYFVEATITTLGSY